MALYPCLVTAGLVASLVAALAAGSYHERTLAVWLPTVLLECSAHTAAGCCRLTARHGRGQSKVVLRSHMHPCGLQGGKQCVRRDRQMALPLSISTAKGDVIRLQAAAPQRRAMLCYGIMVWQGWQGWFGLMAACAPGKSGSGCSAQSQPLRNRLLHISRRRRRDETRHTRLIPACAGLLRECARACACMRPGMSWLRCMQRSRGCIWCTPAQCPQACCKGPWRVMAKQPGARGAAQRSPTDAWPQRAAVSSKERQGKNMGRRPRTVNSSAQRVHGMMVAGAWKAECAAT